MLESKSDKERFIGIVFVCVLVAIFFGFIGYIEYIKQNPAQFYFEGDKEVTRFYYDGWIQLKTDDNSFTIYFEQNPQLEEVR